MGIRHTHDSTDAAAYTGSAEIGYGFKFGGGCGNKTIVAGTPFESDLDGTWYDVGAGITAAWSGKGLKR
jgi:hypothetical protein